MLERYDMQSIEDHVFDDFDLQRLALRNERSLEKKSSHIAPHASGVQRNTDTPSFILAMSNLETLIPPPVRGAVHGSNVTVP